MAISIPSDCKQFRAAVTPGFIFIFVGGMIIGLFVIVIRHGFDIDLSALTVATGVAFIFSIIYSWVLALIFPVAFSSDGIYGHSFWGRRRFVRWQDISSVRTFRLANLQWLRVYAADEKVTWLALFQSHGIEFRQEIRRLAPQGNPILNRL